MPFPSLFATLLLHLRIWSYNSKGFFSKSERKTFHYLNDFQLTQWFTTSNLPKSQINSRDRAKGGWEAVSRKSPFHYHSVIHENKHNLFYYFVMICSELGAFQNLVNRLLKTFVHFLYKNSLPSLQYQYFLLLFYFES